MESLLKLEVLLLEGFAAGSSQMVAQLTTSKAAVLPGGRRILLVGGNVGFLRCFGSVLMVMRLLAHLNYLNLN